MIIIKIIIELFFSMVKLQCTGVSKRYPETMGTEIVVDPGKKSQR